MVNLDDRHLLNFLLLVLQWLIVFLELWPLLLLIGREPNQEVFHCLLPLFPDNPAQEHYHLCRFCVLPLPPFVGFLLTALLGILS